MREKFGKSKKKLDFSSFLFFSFPLKMVILGKSKYVV